MLNVTLWPGMNQLSGLHDKATSKKAASEMKMAREKRIGLQINCLCTAEQGRHMQHAGWLDKHRSYNFQLSGDLGR